VARVNKAQFVESLAERLDGDKKRAAFALDAVLDNVYAYVVKGDRVALTGFGVFEKRERAARTARNPATGASVKVKKTSVPAFRAGAEFRALASGQKKLAKAPAKKVSAAKSPAGKATATAPAKKSPAKKSAAAKSTAKSAAAKAPATKSARKAPARSAASTAPAKKSTARKAPAKRAR
jgi:DNA-binding protein HU-beta